VSETAHVELKLRTSVSPWYEDGVTVLYKECPAETFILAEKPTELLGQYHTFIMDASVSHASTSLFARSVPVYPYTLAVLVSDASVCVGSTWM
jgi:hypothetical protein